MNMLFENKGRRGTERDRDANRDIERWEQGAQTEKNGREGYKETEKITDRKTRRDTKRQRELTL